MLYCYCYYTHSPFVLINFHIYYNRRKSDRFSLLSFFLYCCRFVYTITLVLIVVLGAPTNLLMFHRPIARHTNDCCMYTHFPNTFFFSLSNNKKNRVLKIFSIFHRKKGKKNLPTRCLFNCNNGRKSIVCVVVW